VYLPAIALFLWEFAPGWGTPLDYFLTDKVHGNTDAFGAARGWQYIGNVAAALAYLWLYRKFGLRSLLNWGTFLGVVGGMSFLLIRDPSQANLICFLAGASCGVALASYYSLLIRCCPKELEGVAYMLSYAAFTLAADVSNIVGSWLYDRGGFGLALGISTAVTALIFIPIWFVPRQISDPVEGVTIVDADPPGAEALAS
jgi:MFS family permease